VSFFTERFDRRSIVISFSIWRLMSRESPFKLQEGWGGEWVPKTMRGNGVLQGKTPSVKKLISYSSKHMV
jgi:hypothetical protein